MSDDEETLESFWKDLRPEEVAAPPPAEGVIEVAGKASDLEASLELACLKTTQELTGEFARFSGLPLTSDMLAEVVSVGVKTFMKSWREGLASEDLAGLIELVLDGQNLPLDELRGFVRALPASLLERVARSSIGAATGTHGLMAIEHARRSGLLTEYTLGHDSGRLYAEFVHHDGQTVHFFLDEEFHLPEPQEPPPPSPILPAEVNQQEESPQTDSAQDGVVPPPDR